MSAVMNLGADHVTGPVSHPVQATERVEEPGFRKAHASPGVRAFARELGVDLRIVKGSGSNERILRQDVQGYVRRVLAGTAGGSVTIPRVTQHDDADITSLEDFRSQVNRENEKAGPRVTMLAFLIKAVVAALKHFPDFNASPNGDRVVHEKYFHIGFAADTPNGPMVPVIRNAERKGVLQIADEISALAASARDGKLGGTDIQGGCFSISSLGGTDGNEGGSYSTPLIKASEVATLGIGRAQVKPVWDGAGFVPRLMLPMSLSYDHRVIDAAAAARFTAHTARVLADFRRTIL